MTVPVLRDGLRDPRAVNDSRARGGAQTRVGQARQTLNPLQSQLALDLVGVEVHRGDHLDGGATGLVSEL